jgi:hypothetical protein
VTFAPLTAANIEPQAGLGGTSGADPFLPFPKPQLRAGDEPSGREDCLSCRRERLSCETFTCRPLLNLELRYFQFIPFRGRKRRAVDDLQAEVDGNLPKYPGKTTGDCDELVTFQGEGRPFSQGAASEIGSSNNNAPSGDLALAQPGIEISEIGKLLLRAVPSAGWA